MKLFLAILLAVIGISLASKCPDYKMKVVTKTSKDARGLKKAVDEFRNLFGCKNNMAGPPKKNGRREINWEGAAPFYIPKDFFNRVAALGAVFHTKLRAIGPSSLKFPNLGRSGHRTYIFCSES